MQKQAVCDVTANAFRKNKRHVFICLSKKLIPVNMMHSGAEADSVFSMTYGDGVLYTLKYDQKNGKSHLFVEKAMERIEQSCKQMDETHGFHCISHVLGGKILSFGYNKRKKNLLYQSMFDSLGACKPGVESSFRSSLTSEKYVSCELDVVKKCMVVDSLSNDNADISFTLAESKTTEATDPDEIYMNSVQKDPAMLYLLVRNKFCIFHV